MKIPVPRSILCSLEMELKLPFVLCIFKEQPSLQLKTNIDQPLLHFCCKQVTDRELFTRIVAGGAPGSAHASFLSQRAELLLSQASAKGLTTRAQCLEYLGSHFRVVLNAPSRSNDYQVGLMLLERFVFIHLNAPADKLALLVAMMHKMYALVRGGRGERVRVGEGSVPGSSMAGGWHVWKQFHCNFPFHSVRIAVLNETRGCSC